MTRVYHFHAYNFLSGNIPLAIVVMSQMSYIVIYVYYSICLFTNDVVPPLTSVSTDAFMYRQDHYLKTKLRQLQNIVPGLTNMSLIWDSRS